RQPWMSVTDVVEIHTVASAMRRPHWSPDVRTVEPALSACLWLVSEALAEGQCRRRPELCRPPPAQLQPRASGKRDLPIALLDHRVPAVHEILERVHRRH